MKTPPQCWRRQSVKDLLVPEQPGVSHDGSLVLRSGEQNRHIWQREFTCSDSGICPQTAGMMAPSGPGSGGPGCPAVWGATLDEKLCCLQADLQLAAGSGNFGVPLEQHWRVFQDKHKLSADSFPRVITSCRLDSAGPAGKGAFHQSAQVKLQRTWLHAGVMQTFQLLSGWNDRQASGWRSQTK